MITRSNIQIVGAAGLAALAFGIGQLAAAIPVAAPASPPLVALAAQQIGVRQCLAAISAVAKRGTTGAAMQDILINWDHETPDAAPFFSLTGMGAGTQRAALTITAVPTGANDCAILVERVSSGAENCAQVAARDLPSMPKGQLIDGVTVLQNPKQADETYTLIQNPGSCIVIRRQAVFKWPPRP